MLTLRSIASIANPPYLFRPIQIANRVWREFAWRSSTRKTVRLPWGLPIIVNPNETIGRNIATRGLYDLAVTETLWRLAGPGELAVDVGANIGYTASLLGMRVGPAGRVCCFEPHPKVFASLSENVAAWRLTGRCGSFELRQTALGSRNGTSMLKTTREFKSNEGTATLAGAAECGEGSCWQVCVECLDDLLAGNERIGTIKVDAEGAELDIFSGMKKLLQERRVRDIVFEEQGRFPAPTHRLLASLGYTLMGLEACRLGVLFRPGAPPSVPEGGDPPSYLGTLESDRASARLTRRGWQSFGILRGFGGNS